MGQQKEYYAFISYKREDESWAKWLQHKLEHYKFPTNLNGRNDLPKHIRPTFRDVTDLKPGLLAEEINNALSNSEWLIVVCSPRSAKSQWVCKEAQTFIDLGRADNIIPFVIEGNPFSNNIATECYPEALLNLTGSKELLAANINEMGRDAAAIKVVARMFNLRFDSLWQRYEREQRRKKWMWIGGAVLFALLGLGTGAYFVKQNRTIESQNAQLGHAANRLREDSLTLANHVSRIQADSVLLALQKDSILFTNSLLNKTNKDLAQVNADLKKANNRILQERKGMLVAQSRAVSEKVCQLIQKKDIMSARLLSLEIIENPTTGRPYTPESEKYFRMSLSSSKYDNVDIMMEKAVDLICDINAINEEIVFPHSLLRGEGDGYNIDAMNCCPYNNKVVFSQAGRCYIHNMENGAEIKMEGDVVSNIGFIFSPDNKFVMNISDYYYKNYVWRMSDGSLIKRFDNDNEYDNLLKNWDLENRKKNTLIVENNTTNEYYDIYNLKNGSNIPYYTNDKKFLTYGSDTIYTTERTNVTLPYMTKIELPFVSCCTLSEDNNLLATLCDTSQLVIIDAHTNKSLYKSSIPSGMINSKVEKLMFSKNNKFVMGKAEEGIVVWNLNKKKCDIISIPSSGNVLFICKNANDIVITYHTEEHTFVEIWDLYRLKCTYRRKMEWNDYYGNISIYNNKKLLLNNEECITILDFTDNSSSNFIAYNPIHDGSGCDRMLGARFIDDGNKILIIAASGYHKVIDAKTHRDLYYFEGHSYHIGVVTENRYYNLSSDEKRLTTITGTGVIQICDIPSGLLLEFSLIDGFYWLGNDDVSISNDGHTIYTNCYKYDSLDNIYFYKFVYPNCSELIEHAKHSLLNRSLTNFEKHKYNLK